MNTALLCPGCADSGKWLDRFGSTVRFRLVRLTLANCADELRCDVCGLLVRDATGELTAPYTYALTHWQAGDVEPAEWEGRYGLIRGGAPAVARYAVLVYQAGIANVFAVDCPNATATVRKEVRLMQSDFRTCEHFARGLARAGVQVVTMACNRAGDIARCDWTHDLESQPFSESFRPVVSGATAEPWPFPPAPVAPALPARVQAKIAKMSAARPEPGWLHSPGGAS